MRIGEEGKLTIVGGGMSGALLAILLARRGMASEILDAGPDPRLPATAASGPAPHAPQILSLGERGRYALRLAGLEDEVGREVTAMRGRVIHDRQGQTALQPYGVMSHEALYSIRRLPLVNCLLNAAEASGKVQIHFERRLRDVDWSRRKLVLEDGAEWPYEVLIGADGAISAMRRAMERAGLVQVSQSLLDAGWKAFRIPPDAAGHAVFDPAALHVWPRGGYSMVAMPDTEGAFPAMLFLPLEGDHFMPWGFTELDSWTRQRAFMAFNFPDVVRLVPDLERAFRENPVGRMGTVRCSTWQVPAASGGPALLIGDAAHCIVPFHGQGVNAAFEDCTALMEILEGGAADWETAFGALHGQRQADTEAIADMALDAYRVMRDTVRHRDFMLRKALERELERRHPERFVPRYSLVMFHRIPYAEACRRGHLQADILRELLDGKEALAEVDLERAAHLVSERLSPIAT